MRKLLLIIVVLIALAVSGCRGTRVITVDAPKIEKEYIVKSDTVHQYDSVYVFNDRYVERDTVYLTKVSERYKYLYRTKVDTLVRCDTITVIDTKQIEALAKENDGLKASGLFYRRLGLCLLGIIAVMGLYILLKR